jgi:ribosomal protein L7Ae-like RNA K-turn-binding protein
VGHLIRGEWFLRPLLVFGMEKVVKTVARRSAKVVAFCLSVLAQAL